MEKKQMILKVMIVAKNEMHVVDGWSDELDNYLLFLALCRAALIRRTELGQSMKEEPSGNNVFFTGKPDYPFEIGRVFPSTLGFLSNELKIERRREEVIVNKKWVISGFRYKITGEDPLAIIEAAAQDLGAQLKMVSAPEKTSGSGMLQTWTEYPCRCERCEEYREQRRIERDRSW